MEVFPEAKVVLTVREPETWYDSVKNSIYNTRMEVTSLPMKLALMVGGRYNHYKTTSDVSYAPISFMNGQSKLSYFCCLTFAIHLSYFKVCME